MALLRLLSLLLLLAASMGRAAPAPTAPGKPLTVHFLDVGQGDAALIISPTGKTVLIDGGPPEAGARLAKRLRELVKGPLDLVILTHPHLDHLGGLPKALQAVGARRFMDPGFDHPSDAYRDLLEVVGRDVGQVMVPAPNPQAPETLLTVGLGEGVSLTILWPRRPQEDFLRGTRSDANSNSIVAKLTYGQTAFLFSGDAEPDTEARLLRLNADLSATVLKVGHHGGKHSSTKAFLAAVRPQAAVISCGAGNDYGHPTSEALGRLASAGARVFRTDEQGEVVATSDGSRVTLKPQRGGAAVAVPGTVKPGSVARGPITPDRAGAKVPAADKQAARYVSLKGSKVFHRGDCATLQRSKSERTTYPSREAAARERRPAEDCDP
ncbi:ComEC/Rec2 family competence protein [Myxococcaceae bacterium GXIMD 01537]